VALEQRDHAVIDEIGGRDRRLSIVEFGANHLAVGVGEGLLVDPPNPLHVADIERILGAAVARMLALELAVGFLLGPPLSPTRRPAPRSAPGRPARSWLPAP